MNLLLLEPAELAGDTATLSGRRAAHLRSVLGVQLGSRVRVGVIGGGTGTAEVVALAAEGGEGAAVTLRVELAEAARPVLPIELVLAVPRPKVLSRTVEIAASFGVERISLTNAWRVDKSYLSSPRAAPQALEEAARLGAEQGATTHVAPVRLYRRLMELLDARWPAPAAAADADRAKLVAHPGGAPIEEALGAPGAGGSAVLAIGPEGGWIAREVETFAARGFTVVSLGTAILRVEAAVAAALGQLVMLRRMRTP